MLCSWDGGYLEVADLLEGCAEEKMLNSMLEALANRPVAEIANVSSRIAEAPEA